MSILLSSTKKARRIKNDVEVFNKEIVENVETAITIKMKAGNTFV